MGLDIRMPLGLLFLATGGLMTVFGLLTQGSPIYEKSLSININLIWGLMLLMFGLLMLVLAWTSRRRNTRAVHDAPTIREESLERPPRIH